MALITVTGTIKDANDHLATSGSVLFALSGPFVTAAGKVITAREFTADVDANGQISVSLESTTDASPADKYYRARFVGVVNSRAVSEDLGLFTLPNTPATQDISTLLTSSLPPVTTANQFYDEVPTGTVNGVNVTFVLSAIPKAGTCKLFLNGLLLLEGTDYIRAGSTITMTIPPFINQWLFASYRTL